MESNARIDVGVDPGERSLAIAAVKADREDVPMAVEAMSLVLHDGGVADEKSSKSRLAVRGKKRRDRGRRRRKRNRDKEIKHLLDEHGFPLDADESLKAEIVERFGKRSEPARFPFFARVAMLDPIEDKALARHLFAVAVSHIDRHRGWRNPWVSFKTMLHQTKGSDGLHMTEQGEQWNKAVSMALGSSVPRTLGECAKFAIERDSGVRPTKYARGKAMDASPDSDKIKLDKVQKKIKSAKSTEELSHYAQWFALPIRPFQQDLLCEILLCANAQGFDEKSVLIIAEKVFEQAEPGVDKDKIGPCALEGGERRAPDFLPSVQEFVVRGFVNNLRVVDGGEERHLSGDESEALSNFLLTLRDREKASIRELERLLAETTGEARRIKRDKDALRAEDEEAVYRGKPPVDRVNELIQKHKSKWKSLHTWWRKADRDERERLLSSFDSATRSKDTEQFVQSLVESRTIDDTDLEAFAEALPGGRSKYSQKAINKILTLMRSGKGLYTARKQAYDLPEDWKPEGALWDRPRFDHPVLQVARSQIAPILTTIDREVGIPTSIRMEMARQTLRLKTPSEAQDTRHKQRRELNKAARDEAESIGLKGKGAVRKLRIIGDQNTQCAYQLACKGAALDPFKAEIDHIVPSSVGANNTRANLVAVCEACNQFKSDRPFAVVASEGQLESTIERVKGWNFEVFGLTLEKDMIARLKTTEPDELDERVPTTTAQTAKELIGMVADRYGRKGEQIETGSVMALLVGEARFTAGLNDVLPGSRASGRFKSRQDNRNHLVDAIVTACINDRVIPILRIRAGLRDFAGLNKGNRSEDGLVTAANEYEGEENYQITYFRRWLVGLKGLKRQLEELFERDIPPGEFRAHTGEKRNPLDLDAVVPRRPLRLKAYGGPLHEENPRGLEEKRLGDEWTAAELKRVADEAIAAEMVRLAKRTASHPSLPPDTSRRLEINDRLLTAESPILMVHKSGAVMVRGASFIAANIHHLRVYRVDGQVRPLWVYAIDVVRASQAAHANGPVTDGRPTSLQLIPECVSLRNGSAVLRYAAVDGHLGSHVAWIAPGDELCIGDTSLVKARFKRGEPKSCELPEAHTPLNHIRRWNYAGGTGSTMIIKPAVVDPNALTVGDERSEREIMRFEFKVAMLTDPSVVIIRRDPLGRPLLVQPLGMAKN